MLVKSYILNFLIGTDISQYCEYSKTASDKPLTIISSNFFDDGVYGTEKTMPAAPFQELPESDIPFLFGESKIERSSGGCGGKRIVLYADIVASSYFLLSRYEEILKPECRDQHGRFRAKDSVIFQQGYGFCPLVDEWGMYLRSLLRELGVFLPEEKRGFSKIYLTHDVDRPFQIKSFFIALKQWIKNTIHHGEKIPHPLGIYRKEVNDPFYTFPKIIEYDNSLRNKLGTEIVEIIYFLIAAGSWKTKQYCNIKSKKYKKLVQTLKESGASLGLHVSHEAGIEPSLLKGEVKRLSSLIDVDVDNLKSRHHYLKWTEPEHIEQIQRAGIKEDFTLGFADSVGFRCGTSKPYYFINPKTKEITDVLIHPMQIMECSLDATQYMGLDYEKAVSVCRRLISEVYKHGGELNLLFHNTSFCENSYHDRLYNEINSYVINIYLEKK